MLSNYLRDEALSGGLSFYPSYVNPLVRRGMLDANVLLWFLYQKVSVQLPPIPFYDAAIRLIKVQGKGVARPLDRHTLLRFKNGLKKDYVL